MWCVCVIYSVNDNLLQILSKFFYAFHHSYDCDFTSTEILELKIEMSNLAQFSIVLQWVFIFKMWMFALKGKYFIRKYFWLHNSFLTIKKLFF